MFDIGWTEMMVIAIVAIIVVGPKDLPKMLRGIGKAVSGMRRMAGDFQKQFDEAVKEADLDDVKKIATDAKSITKDVKSFSPLEDAKKAAEKYNREIKETLAQKGEASVSAKPSDTIPEPVKAPGPGKADTAADTKLTNADASSEGAKPATKSAPKAKRKAKPAKAEKA